MPISEFRQFENLLKRYGARRRNVHVCICPFKRARGGWLVWSRYQITPVTNSSIDETPLHIALVSLHNLNITNRDLEPDSLLIIASDPIQIKVADFGLSKLIIDRRTQLKTFRGSPPYCAPDVYFDEYEMKEAKR